MNKLVLIALLSLLPIPAHAFDSDESDKQRHIVVSALMVASAYALTEDLKTAVLITLGVGVGKELIDSQKKNGDGFDPNDLAADLAGIGIGVLWVYKF